MGFLFGTRHYGDLTPGKTLRLFFNTTDSIGDPVNLVVSPAAAVLRDGDTVGTVTGVTLATNYLSTTGLHKVTVDTSADPSYFLAGADYQVILYSGAFDSFSAAGRVVGSFSLSNRSALRPATADRTLAVSAAGVADADLVAAAIDEILDEAVEGSITLRQAMRVLLAFAVGKASGAGGSTITFRDQADTKNRISATVTSQGNRTAVSLDVS